MPEMDIDPEDRRRLVRATFSELAREFLNSEEGTRWFDERVKAMHEAAGTSPARPQPQPQQQPQSHRPQRRGSLFEKVVLGIE